MSQDVFKMSKKSQTNEKLIERRAFLDEESDEKFRFFAAYINKPKQNSWNDLMKLIDWDAIWIKIAEKKTEATKKEEELPSWDQK